MSETVPLRDAIRALRVELLEAVEDASTQAVRFELGTIELEFQVVARREKEGKAKIGFHIFGAEASVGGTGGRGDERTQTVKLVLNPVLLGTDGGRSKLDIGRRRAGK
jgi:hypothetical protein